MFLRSRSTFSASSFLRSVLNRASLVAASNSSSGSSPVALKVLRVMVGEGRGTVATSPLRRGRTSAPTGSGPYLPGASASFRGARRNGHLADAQTRCSPLPFAHC
jgi:hypothetical protein